MNPQNSLQKRPLARRAPMLVAAASLLVVPCLFAQTPAPAAKGPSTQTSLEGNPSPPAKEKLHSLKFEGSGDAWNLTYALREQLSAENIVMTDSARRVRIPAFELRNVRVADIAHTIEFVSEGQLRVEVTENAGSGSVWLIGRKSSAETAATVKMRSVAAPNLFANEKALAEIVETAKRLEVDRYHTAEVNGSAGGVAQFARVEPLKSQKIFVIAGDEEGVAGLESFIKSAEQRLADAAAATAAELASNGPRMRAVLAPHVFVQEQRWKNLMKAAEGMRGNWLEFNAELLKEVGWEGRSVSHFGLPWVKVDPDQEQKVFVISGTEAAIAGMESLINAAEQLAREEDEKIRAGLKPDARPAKEGKSEQ